MSLKQKFISTVTLAVAVGAFGTYVSAQETPAADAPMQKQERMDRGGRGKGMGMGMRGGKHGGGGDRMMMRELKQLNLTDAQKEQARTIFENHRTQNQPQMEEMRGLSMKKRDGVITEQEQTRLSELKTQLKSSGDQLHTSILGILTAEQRTQLDKLKAERMEKMNERRMNRKDQPNQAVPPSTDN